MEELIKNLFPMNRTLIGEGFDNALEYIKHLIPLKILEFKSGTKLETWTVPDEWIVRDAWVKDPDGNKIIDYKKDPLSLVVGTKPFHGVCDLEELRLHWYYDEDNYDTVPYMFKYYPKENEDINEWGFCVRKTDVLEKIPQGCEGGVCVPELKDIDPSVGKVMIEGIDYSPKFQEKLKEGSYEVFIDTEYKKGKMKIGVHTIKGDEREILLFAHLDGPFQANGNLSGVACLVDLAKKLKSKHTIKIIFCPATIGSIAYALTQDISKVEFMIAVDMVGNDAQFVLQKSLMESKINDIAHLAIFSLGKDYKFGKFRATVGSDEYAFNDPLINVPGILITRYPYKEYHNADDTPEKIHYDKIEEAEKIITKIIEYWDKDFIPKRNFKAPLRRSKYGIQSSNPQLNLSYDYFFYGMDGTKSLSELCTLYGLDFEQMLMVVNQMIEENDVKNLSVALSKGRVKKTPKQK